VSVLYFLLMVGVLVFVHEAGHFVAAKVFGVRVTIFSLGFGRRAAGIRLGETEYRLSWIPLGGYVRLLMDDARLTAAERAQSFTTQKLWKRVTITLAGPAANFLLAVAIYFSFFAGHTHLRAPTIGAVFAGQPAALGGLLPGDEVLSVDGDDVDYWDQVEDHISEHRGKTLRFRVRRGDGELERFVTPQSHVLRDRLGREKQVGWIGISQQAFRPQIGVIDLASPAGRAGLRTGDLITTVNNRPVRSWSEAERLLTSRTGASLNITFLRGERPRWGFADVRTYQAGVATVWPDAVPQSGNQTALHYKTGIASAELFVAEVEPGSPAERIGLAVGARVTALDGRPIQHWLLLEDALLAAPDREFELTWEAPGGVATSKRFTQQTRHERDEYKQDRERLVFGARNDFLPADPELRPIRGRLGYAAGKAIMHTGHTIAAMVTGIAALLTGDEPSTKVGGPVMLYHITNVSAEKGFDSFMLMLALISVNLGLLNLLPLPQLDGGQLVQTVLASVRRQQLSPRTREAVAMAGLVIIISLAVLALRNDIVRFVIR